MRLAHAFRRFVVPVQSQLTERRQPQLVVDAEPEAGTRWGRPAAFDQASRPRPSDEPAGFTAEWIDTYRVFKGIETHREYSRAPAGDTESPRASGASRSTAAPGRSAATPAASSSPAWSTTT